MMRRDSLPTAPLRMNSMGLVVLGLASVAAGLVSPLPAEERTAGSSGTPVKLMSFNVAWMGSGGGWHKRQPVIIEAICRHDPDIIGFQEPQRVQREALARDLPDYAAWGNVKGRAADGKQEANPIFYKRERFRIDEEESKRFWLSDTPDVPGSITWDNRFIRICEVARLIDLGSGKALYVYNSHWTFSRNEANLKGAQLILDRIHRRNHDDPVVLMGDFNATVDQESIQLVTARHPHVTLRDAFSFMDPNPALEGTFHKGFDGVPSGEQIDYIFIDPGRLRVLDAEVVKYHRDGVYPSDHYPLIATIAPRRAAGGIGRQAVEAPAPSGIR